MDQTLIYSLRQLARHGQSSVGRVIVEELHGAPLSVVDFSVLQTLIEGHGREFSLIPVTTRTHAQYSRIQFPGLDISTYIILNGGRIFLHGKELASWTVQMAEELARLSVQPMELHARVSAELDEVEGLKAVHHAERAFVYVVKDKRRVPLVDEYLVSLAAETGYVLSNQDKKSYLMPPNLSKGRAVEELMKHLGPRFTLAAGDSVLDLTMREHVDYFLIPSHGEASLNHVAHEVTTGVGLQASVELMEALSGRL